MGRKKAIIKKVAKDWIVVDHKHRIIGKVKIREGKYMFRTHQNYWIDHHTMYYINLLIWQLRRHHERGEGVGEVTGFEPGLHIFIKDHSIEWEDK
jgi:hypothetical protein